MTNPLSIHDNFADNIHYNRRVFSYTVGYYRLWKLLKNHNLGICNSETINLNNLQVCDTRIIKQTREINLETKVVTVL